MKTKTMSALLMLVLLMLSSVPFVFADQGGRDAANVATTDIDTTDADTATDTVTANTTGNARAKSDKARVAAHVAETRENLVNARAKVKALNAGTADKKAFLEATADRILELLNKLKERVEASEVDDKAERLATIDESIAAVTAAKAKIDSLDSETATRQALKDAAQDIREAWKKAQHVLRESAVKVVQKRVGNIVARMEQLATRLDKVLAKLQEKGYDLANTTALKEQFDAKLASAKQHADASKAKFGAKDVSAANDEMKQAMAALKEAHALLKELVRSVKAATPANSFENAENETAGQGSDSD